MSVTLDAYLRTRFVANTTARTSPGCTGSDGRTSLTLPLANTGKFVAGLETFWRRKKGPQLTAEIPEGNWRGVRDSNPWPPA